MDSAATDSKDEEPQQQSLQNNKQYDKVEEKMSSSTRSFLFTDSSEVIVNENDDGIKSYRQHFKDVSSITCPIILSEFFQNTLPVMDIAFVGHLEKEDLAAAALATVWFNLWNATMMGFMTAIDTLLSQSYGANQHEKFGIWTGNSPTHYWLLHNRHFA